jgi:hypothetical protein
VLWLAIGLLPAAIGVRALHNEDPRIVTTTPAWTRGAERFRRIAERLPVWVRRESVAIGQPLWWVARGSIGGIALYAATMRGTIGWQLPAVLGAVVSIWLGRRSQRDRRMLWFLVPLNLVAVFAMLVLAFVARTGFPSLGYWLTDSYYTGSAGSASSTRMPGLALDGRPVDNVFPFDQQGKPLTNIRLYDASGRPLNLTSERCAPSGIGGTTWLEDNVYPKPTAHASADGSTCKDTSTPPLVVPPLTPAATTGR